MKHLGTTVFIFLADMDQTFPLMLSAKYLTAGLGTVMGILSAALATVAMREMHDHFKSATFNGGSVMRKVSFQPPHSSEQPPGTAVRKASKSSNQELTTELTQNKQQEEMMVINVMPSPAVTETAANGLIETCFP